jgi:transcriptional regulator with XRE-family HTH domain
MGQPPTPAQARLAAILRGLRDGAGLTTYDLAERLGWSQARVTRIENMRTRRFAAADVEQWAQAAGAPEPVRDELAQLVYEASTEARSWHISHRAGLAARQREMAEMERSATAILHFQPEAIPGLLQTEDYARRLLGFADITGKGGIDAAVRERMKRQAILRKRGRRFEYILTEGALRYRPGPPSMMGEQLGKLVAAAALPAVTLGVIPYDREARTAYIQAFMIFRADDGPVALTEGYTKEDFLAAPVDIETLEREFALLRESALAGADALDFARAVMLA